MFFWRQKNSVKAKLDTYIALATISLKVLFENLEMLAQNLRKLIKQKLFKRKIFASKSSSGHEECSLHYAPEKSSSKFRNNYAQRPEKNNQI